MTTQIYVLLKNRVREFLCLNMYMYMYQKIVIYTIIVMLTMFKDLIKNEQ